MKMHVITTFFDVPTPDVATDPEARNYSARHRRKATDVEAGLVEAIDHGFREMYYTLISIIQGVAFGFLAERAFTGQKPSPEQWIAFTICFMAIIAVWHEYMIGSTVFTWTPTLLDSAIPFAIGMTEFQLIAGARSSVNSFLIRLTAFLAVGTTAYVNWAFHARRGKTNIARYETLKSYIRFGTLYCAAATAATLLLALGLATEIGFNGAPLLAATLVGVAPLVLHSTVNWNLQLNRIRARIRDAEYGLVEAPSTQPETP